LHFSAFQEFWVDQYTKDARHSDIEVMWAVHLLDGWLLSGSQNQKFQNVGEIYYAGP